MGELRSVAATDISYNQTRLAVTVSNAGIAPRLRAGRGPTGSDSRGQGSGNAVQLQAHPGLPARLHGAPGCGGRTYAVHVPYLQLRGLSPSGTPPHRAQLVKVASWGGTGQAMLPFCRAVAGVCGVKTRLWGDTWSGSEDPLGEECFDGKTAHG